LIKKYFWQDSEGKDSARERFLKSIVVVYIILEREIVAPQMRLERVVFFCFFFPLMRGSVP
jgi:hypothetical protein